MPAMMQIAAVLITTQRLASRVSQYFRIASAGFWDATFDAGADDDWFESIEHVVWVQKIRGAIQILSLGST